MWPNFGFSWGGFMDGILGVLVAFFYCYWLLVMMARSVVALRVQVAVVANIGGG
jgi:hypothetical protein